MKLSHDNQVDLNSFIRLASLEFTLTTGLTSLSASLDTCSSGSGGLTGKAGQWVELSISYAYNSLTLIIEINPFSSGTCTGLVLNLDGALTFSLPSASDTRLSVGAVFLFSKALLPM